VTCVDVSRGRPATCYKYSITCQDDLLTVDNAQSHVTSFRPISEAARSWSDDNEIWWPSLKNVALWRTQTTVLHLFCCMTNHTHPFNGPLSGTTRVSRYYQKGKTNLDFTEARDSEWQWHQAPLSFLQAGCPSWCPTNSVKSLKAKLYD